MEILYIHLRLGDQGAAVGEWVMHSAVDQVTGFSLMFVRHFLPRWSQTPKLNKGDSLMEYHIYGETMVHPENKPVMPSM